MAKENETPDVEGEGGSAELVPITSAEDAAQALAGLQAIDVEDPTATQLAIARRILTSETQDQAFEDIPTYSTKDMVGVPFTANDVRVFRSRYGADGKGAFVAVDAVRLDNGERCIVNTSAIKPASRLLWLKLHEALPMDVLVREGAETAAGFRVLDLEVAGK